jgi:predicted ArsR family transcriptional regulator
VTRLESIADPVRLGVARHLADHPTASAQDVAAGVGVHLNTARSHLAALEEAGVLDRVSESGGRRGRPIVRYRLVKDWAPAGEELLSLSRLLAAAVHGVDHDAGELRDLAHEYGKGFAKGASGPTEERLTAALDRLGFRARLIDGRLVLSDCPCPLVAPDGPQLICSLADAATDGVLEGSELATGRREHDPSRRRCSTTLRAA